MANAEHISILKAGVAEWNHWRASTNHSLADLCGADLSGMKLNGIDFLRADLKGAILTETQLEHAHLKNADLTGATLDAANLEHANARSAIFDQVVANKANFEVSTLRGARFRRAQLSGARFHRAYLRDADLSDAAFTGCWLRFATLNGACCQNTDFSSADLRHASMVETNLKGANLTDVHVFGISAWGVETDANTRQDLIVGVNANEREAPLRTHDLRTAQLLSLMLDAAGVRSVIDSVSSKLVLILGSFSPSEKVVLDALRESLQRYGYIAVEFDFERPSERDYAETVLTLVGMSRFVVADFTNAKEVRAEVAQARRQYKRVPIIPIAREGVALPITMANSFSVDELQLLVRYHHIDDLLQKVRPRIIEPAEERVRRIADGIARSEAILLGAATSGGGV
jgi:uncharacterized protein YjbI with pentapeptide repeats